MRKKNNENVAKKNNKGFNTEFVIFKTKQRNVFFEKYFWIVYLLNVNNVI